MFNSSGFFVCVIQLMLLDDKDLHYEAKIVNNYLLDLLSSIKGYTADDR